MRRFFDRVPSYSSEYEDGVCLSGDKYASTSRPKSIPGNNRSYIESREAVALCSRLWIHSIDITSQSLTSMVRLKDGP